MSSDLKKPRATRGEPQRSIVKTGRTGRHIEAANGTPPHLFAREWVESTSDLEVRPAQFVQHQQICCNKSMMPRDVNILESENSDRFQQRIDLHRTTDAWGLKDLAKSPRL